MDLRYHPIGSFKLEGASADEDIGRAIDEIGEAPAKLRPPVWEVAGATRHTVRSSLHSPNTNR